VPRSSPSNLASLGHRWAGLTPIAIAGPDRTAFLQGQLTQDVRNLAPGESRPAAGLTPKGKLIFFGPLVGEPDRLLLLVARTAAEAVLAHLTRYGAFQDVQIRDASAQLGVLHLYGPETARLEIPAAVLRLPARGEFAGELLVPAAVRAELETRLERGGSELVGEATAEVLRVEAGRPRWGQDADGSNLPDEVGLQDSVSPDKGCYVGQEVVARLRTYGRVNRRLVGFRFPGGALPAGTVFSDPGKRSLELGRVTSSVLSPRLGPIGLGLAFRDVPEGGTLGLPGEARTAVVAPLPFA
jgi:tRNA-modifying protein YgfZ